jgi:hypothetical protein
MKQIVFGVVGAVLLVVSLMAAMTVLGRTSRENEMDDILSAAVDETLSNLTEKQAYSIADEEEFAADFCESLLQEIKTGTEDAADENLKIQVDITGIDVEKGLLSVQVTEWFTYPNGSIGSITRNATALLEQQTQAAQHKITYLVDGVVYREFGITAQEDFVIPTEPGRAEGRKFAYWKDTATGAKAEFPDKVTEDKTYEAVFL